MSGARRDAQPAALALVAAAIVLAPRPAVAAGEDELVSLINARRAETRGCSGAREAAAGPLAPSPLLARVDAAAAAGDLGKALIAAGYRAATATTLVLSGVADASAAARLVEQQHCDVVAQSPLRRDRRRAAAARRWRINLAAPLLAGDLGDWRAAGQAVLAPRQRRAPARRRAAATQRFAAARAARLERPARRRCARRTAATWPSTTTSTTPTGAGAASPERAREQGYPWRVVGENIAAGQGSAAAGRRRLAGEPGPLRQHPLAPTSPRWAPPTRSTAQAAMEIYWTQVFGAR